DLVSPNRFLIGVFKDITAFLMRKPTFLFCSSVGPFKTGLRQWFAKKILKHFTHITLRESESKLYLESIGYDCVNVSVTACPAWIFEKQPKKSDINEIETVLKRGGNRKKVGLI